MTSLDKLTVVLCRELFFNRSLTSSDVIRENTDPRVLERLSHCRLFLTYQINGIIFLTYAIKCINFSGEKKHSTSVFLG